MTLGPSTLATFERFKEADWFARVGLDVVDAGKITVPVTIISSWPEAIKHCQENEWDLVLNESANLFRRRLSEASKEEYNRWNDRIRAVKKVSEPLVREKLAVIQSERALPASVGDTLRWIVTLTLTEAEYAHVIEAGNHAKLAFWIVNGHFPCGWKGEFPNGNLIIY